jgi:hypothetical protein
MLETDGLELHALGYNVLANDTNKRPIGTWKRWQDERQAERDVLALPWRRAAFVGVVQGPVSGGFTCLEFDVKNGEPGLEAYEYLTKQYGPFAFQRSRSGGIHAFARTLEDIRVSNLFLDGERCGELRGFGGQLNVWDKSAFLDVNSLPFVPVLEGRLRADRKSESVQRPIEPRREKTCGELSQTGLNAYAQKAFDNEIQALRCALRGSRNSALVRAAFCLGQLVSAGILSESMVQSELEDAATHIGLDQREALATIKSGLKGGAANPRNLSKVGTLESVRTLATSELWQSGIAIKDMPWSAPKTELWQSGTRPRGW